MRRPCIYGQVVVGLVLGILVGVFYPDFAVTLKPLGDGFM
jgi:aerobic C4-dicarboxylate transport protein